MLWKNIGKSVFELKPLAQPNIFAFGLVFSTSTHGSKQAYLGQARRELRIPYHNQHKLPCAYLFLTLTISTPIYFIVQKLLLARCNYPRHTCL
jgi:hypothetical protein